MTSATGAPDPTPHLIPAQHLDPAQHLREQRAALQSRLGALAEDMGSFFEASRDSNADDEHDPEGQTIAFERAQLAAVTDQVRGHLQEVDAALERIAGDTYGRCEVCLRPIPRERLEVRPTARTCVQHAGAAASGNVT